MIETISNYLHWLGAETLSVLWTPLLLWTALALPLYGLLRWREVGLPHVRYRIFQALLLALPIGLVVGGLLDLVSFFPGAALEQTSGPPRSTILISLPAATSLTKASSALGWSLYQAAGLLTALAALLALRRLLLLGGEVGKLYRLRRRLTGRFDRNVQRKLGRLCRRMELHRNVQAIVTSNEVVPMTFGFYRPTIVIPESIASDADQLQMTLAHELTHIRRCDYLHGWFEHLISSLFAILPLTDWLRRDICACREMACDAEVLEMLSCSKQAYASLLLQVVLPTGRKEPIALAMSDHASNLKRRIRVMKKHTRNSLMKKQAVGWTLGTACLAIIGVFVACTDFVSEESADTPTPAAATRTSNSGAPPAEENPEVFVAVEQMPELKGGLLALQEEITYPEKAREADVEGQVIVQFVVDKQGNVQNPQILRGVGAGCDREALRVVEQAEFEPGLQQGEPVHVKMSLPIRFQLNQG